ncbi:hypothetical protein KDW54_07000 [Burkholderia ambifaria]|nr:hypothetical protein [Burkholderia ambifaria]MBR8182143.1 hypothetical protein [Burkholderia ambifaria]
MPAEQSALHAGFIAAGEFGKRHHASDAANGYDEADMAVQAGSRRAV